MPRSSRLNPRAVADATVAAVGDLRPCADPVGALTWSLAGIIHWKPVIAVGVDGNVYGRNGTTVASMSTDSWVSTVDGPDFASLHSGAQLVYVNRLSEGWVFATDNSSNDTLIWWFSPASQTWGPSMTVTQIVSCRSTTLNILGVSMPKPGPDGKSVLLYGEYGGGYSTARKLWMTRDGGQTWTSILTIGPGTDTANACHFHQSTYDPKRQRIIASTGDVGNRGLFFSDDWGRTWKRWTQPSTSPYYNSAAPAGNMQPTAVIVIEDRVFGTPDEGSIKAGLIEMDLDAPERPGIRRFFTSVDTFGAGQYGYGQIAQRGREVYMCFPDTGSGSKLQIMAATGDGGRTWWQLGTIATSGSNSINGIAGPDKNGYLFFTVFNATGFGQTGTRTVRAKVIDWKFRHPQAPALSYSPLAQ